MISSSTRGAGDPTVGTLIKSQLWKDAFNDDLIEVDVKVGALGEESLLVHEITDMCATYKTFAEIEGWWDTYREKDALHFQAAPGSGG